MTAGPLTCDAISRRRSRSSAKVTFPDEATRPAKIIVAHQDSAGGTSLTVIVLAKAGLMFTPFKALL